MATQRPGSNPSLHSGMFTCTMSKQENCSASFPNTSPISWTPSYRRPLCSSSTSSFSSSFVLGCRSLHTMFPQTMRSCLNTSNGITIHPTVWISVVNIFSNINNTVSLTLATARRHASSSILAYQLSLFCIAVAILLPLYRQLSQYKA